MPVHKTALTKFADMTPEEFKAKMLMPKGRVELMLADIPANVADTSRMLQDIVRGDCGGEMVVDRSVQLLTLSVFPYLQPKSFDWRDQGNFVTPVKNQGQCG